MKREEGLAERTGRPNVVDELEDDLGELDGKVEEAEGGLFRLREMRR
jgi:hypothetical protein